MTNKNNVVINANRESRNPKKVLMGFNNFKPKSEFSLLNKAILEIRVKLKRK